MSLGSAEEAGGCCTDISSDETGLECWSDEACDEGHGGGLERRRWREANGRGYIAGGGWLNPVLLPLSLSVGS